MQATKSSFMFCLKIFNFSSYSNWKKTFRVMTTESAGENGGGNRKNPRPEVQLYRPGITRLSRSEHEAQQEQRGQNLIGLKWSKS